MSDPINTVVESAGITGWLKGFIDHNRWIFAFVVWCLTLAGCAFWQPTAPSPTDPEKRVTRAQLQAEVDTFIARLEASEAELEAKEWAVQQAINAASGLVTAVPGPWAGVAGLALTTAPIFFGINSARKTKVINQLKVKGKK